MPVLQHLVTKVCPMLFQSEMICWSVNTPVAKIASRLARATRANGSLNIIIVYRTAIPDKTSSPVGQLIMLTFKNAL